MRWVPSLSPLKGGEGLFSDRLGAEQRGQFFDAVAIGKGLEALARLALREIGAEHGFEAPGQFVGRDVAADLAAERQLRAAAAADNHVIPLGLRIVAGAAEVDLGGEEADIADIMLRAGIGAAGQVDVERLVEVDPRIEMIGDFQRMALGIAQ